MKPIRILDANTYQVSKSIVAYYRTFGSGKHNATNQLGRADRFVNHVKINNYDVITMQELYGEGKDRIFRGLKAQNYVIKQRYNRDGNNAEDKLVGFYELIRSGTLSTAKDIMTKTGGLGTASKNELPVVWHYHHIYENYNEGEKEHYKGVSFTLLDTEAHWGQGTFLLVGNTHLSSTSAAVRREQRNELMQALIAVQDMPYPPNFSWQKCGIVIAGDFNTCYGDNRNNSFDYRHNTQEYWETVNYSMGTQMRDTIVEANPDEAHISTFDPCNTYVEPGDDFDGRIDYIFVLNEIPTDQGGKISVMPLKVIGAGIVRHPRGEEVSDHYLTTAALIPY